MERKIAIVSEIGFLGKLDGVDYNRNILMVLIDTLDATHLNYEYASQHLEEFDFTHYFIIPSKTHPEKMDLCSEIREKHPSAKIMLNQEGPYNYWMGWGMDVQAKYYDLMKSCDYFVYNNECDEQYYNAICDKTILLPVPIDCDYVDKQIIPRGIVPYEKRLNIALIGGSCTPWYNGQNSMIVASTSNVEKICSPTMGRDKLNEEKILNKMFSDKQIVKLRFLQFDDWAKLISQVKFAVHLMPAIGGGNMTNICASVGTPIIGNELWDTQLTCFPELAINARNLRKAKFLVSKLETDKTFYEKVSVTAFSKCRLYFDKHKVRELVFHQLDKYEVL